MPKIRDIAKACKSKNAGPYELTLDIMFGDRETFEKVRATGVISRALIARLYGVAESAVVFTEFPPAFAWKATIERRIASGKPDYWDHATRLELARDPSIEIALLPAPEREVVQLVLGGAHEAGHQARFCRRWSARLPTQARMRPPGRASTDGWPR